MPDSSLDPASSAIADAPRGNWIDRFAPTATKPYLRLSRLDRPIGTWLLLLPCWWGIALAAPASRGREFVLFVLFAIGAVVMRGAGCTFNDIVDRDFDRRVARTRNRPLASGEVGLAMAALWMAVQVLIGLGVLLALGRPSLIAGALSLPLIAIYPFMKRVTWWPQLFLGLAFNWGALLGFVAVAGRIAPAPIMLYLGGIAWTLGYDTIYAHQDKEDDALIGVRSSARHLGPRTRPFLFAVYAATYVEIAAAGRLAGFAWSFLLLLLPAAAHLLWQATTVKTDDTSDCLAKFRANRDFGLLVLAALLIAPLLPPL